MRKYSIRKTPSERPIMGTRNLTVVKDASGEVKIAQYGQWDGYPSGQGLTALNFLSSPANVAALKDNLDLCYWIGTDEHNAILSNYANNDGWMDMETGERFKNDYPSLTRDICSDILQYVTDCIDKVPLVNEYDFKDDQLFCEGIYEVNFQTNKFISTYGKVVEFDLDNLPNEEEYLKSFEESLTNA
jgi:hypothetical protein